MIALVRPVAIEAESVWLHVPMAVAATWLLCLAIALGGGLGRRAGAVLLLIYASYVAAAIVAAV